MSIRLWILLTIIVIVLAVVGLRIFKKLPDQVITMLIFLSIMAAVIGGLIMLFRKMSQGSSWN